MGKRSPAPAAVADAATTTARRSPQRASRSASPRRRPGGGAQARQRTTPGGFAFNARAGAGGAGGDATAASPPPPPSPAATPAEVLEEVGLSRAGAARCCRKLKHNLTFDDMASTPGYDFLADNEAIVTGYRRVMPFREALASFCALHNETMNVWTHAVGAATFLALAVYVAAGGVTVTAAEAADVMATTVEAAEDSPVVPVIEHAAHAMHDLVIEAMPRLAQLHIDDGASVMDPVAAVAAAAKVPTWPILVFLASAITLLLASASYHLLHIVRRAWFDRLSKLDYAAIAVLIAGSSVPALYYAFYCAPGVMAFYLALNFTTCGTTLVVGLHPRFADLKYRLVRMSTFIATGLLAGVPFVHMLIGTDLQVGEAVYGLLLMGALYISGALLYGFRIPERWAPGRFDLFGASHQLFHIAVVAAAAVHYLTVVSHYRWRTHHAQCAAVSS